MLSSFNIVSLYRLAGIIFIVVVVVVVVVAVAGA